MKTLFLFLITFLVATHCNATGTGYVSLVGKQFKDGDGNDFYPVMMNYFVHLSYNTYPITQAIDVDINPWNNYGTENHFEHQDGAQAIQNDLHEIAHLGFNSIRLIFGLKRYTTPISGLNCTSTDPLFTFDWFIHSGINTGNRQCFAIRPPYSADASQNLEMSIYLLKVEEVLSIAEDENLKVVLLTADGYDLFSTPNDDTAVNDYAAFLNILGAYFATNTTIIAYDLDNEPHYKDGDQQVYNRRKNEVCTYTGILYDAIKGSDPNHLVTIGLGDEGTVETWDPEVIKADFVSLHLYPYFVKGKDFGDHTGAVQHFTDRLLAKIYWASKFVQRPWILGETGFTSVNANLSENYWNWYGFNGNYTQMQTFISNLLTVVKDCGVSGIAWWNFQDSFSSDDPPALPLPPIPPDPTSQESKNYREECWGLLKKGDPIGSDYSACEKMSSSPFVGFDQIPPQTVCSVAPPEFYDDSYIYYDPFQNHVENNTQATSCISGYVRDQFSNVIEGAVVIGDCWMNTDYGSSGLPEYENYTITTFSDKAGYYKLIPFNFHPDHLNDNRITKASVRSLGATNFAVPSGTDASVASSIDFNLTKSALDFNSNIEIDLPIPSGQLGLFYAWNTVNISGEIEGNGDITARQEINLQDGFYAKDASEVHVYTSDVFHNCDDDFAGYRSANNSAVNELNVAGKNISLSFTEIAKSFRILIYPLPNTGKFTLLLLNKNSGIKTTITIRNLSGSRIFQTETNSFSIELNLTTISKGIYFVDAINQNEVCTSKLIIQ